MPEITPLGWFHTIIGIIALVSGAYTLFKFKEITHQTRSGEIYLITTLITAVTALAIYQHGFFGPAHVLALMTLGALAIGMFASTTGLFGKASRYVRAFFFSATLLFHCIPAVTDFLLRIPVGDPFLTSIEDPILRMCYLGLLILFLVGVTLQLRWISGQRAVDAAAELNFAFREGLQVGHNGFAQDVPTQVGGTWFRLVCSWGVVDALCSQ